MILITDLNDPRIHPDKVSRIRNGSRQEFRINEKRSFKGDFYIDPPERHFYLDRDGDNWKWVNGCNGCNGEPRGYSYIECNEHDVCRLCGCGRAEAIGAWGGRNGWACNKCKDMEHEQDKSAALALMPDEFNERDYEGLHKIKCPYCDYKFSDSWEHADDEEEGHECPRCDNEFTVTAIQSLTFDCNRIDE